MKSGNITTIPNQETSTQELLILNKKGKPHIDPVTSYLMTLGSKKSRATMASYLKNVAKIWGFEDPRDIPWTQVEKHHVLAIIETLNNRKYSASTIRVYCSAIKGAAKEAWEQKLIDAEHLERIKMIRTKKGKVRESGRRLQSDEIKKLINSCEASPKGARDKAIISIAAECGLRRSEIVGLNLNDVDFQMGSLSIIGKGNKHRVVYLPKLSEKALIDWIKGWRGEAQGPLFNRILKNDTVTESRLSSQAILFILEKRRCFTGLDKFSPHDLRRTFATTLFEKNIDPLTIQKAMGHENLSTTELYDKRNDERIKEVANEFSYF